MSLPSYRAQQDKDLSAPLFPGAVGAIADGGDPPRPSIESLPGYGPSGPAQTEEPTVDTVGRSNVIYTFKPRYPISSSEEASVLGVLAYTKTDAIDIVRRGIPFLATYPDERFEFFVPIAMQGTQVASDDWAPVMDDVWPTFAVSGSPKRMRVRIIERPEDTKSRVKNEKMESYVVFAVIAGFILGMIAFGIWLSKQPTKK